MENQKIAKTVRIVDKILKIAQAFLRAFIIVCGIFIVLTLIFGEKVIADASSVQLGYLSLRLKSSAIPDFAALRSFIIPLLAISIVILVAGLFVLRILRSILASMKEGKPFEAGISDKVRKLAWVYLIGGGITEVCRMLGNIVELRAYDLSTLFNMENIASIGYFYDFRLGFVVVFGILLFLSLVFRCGETLQQESDETL